MKKQVIFFDLDGTLTDSGEGIINCAILALEHFGIPVPGREALRAFVGPPLRDVMIRFGIPAERVEEAIDVFRARYFTVGKFENFPYPGIRELLETLKQQGFRLFVATSKPETMALEILHKFELDFYFEEICGATLDSSRVTKEDVIACLLEKAGGAENVVMVGDTAFDVKGAACHRIPTIGVAWGYGSAAEMTEAGAVAIAETPEELIALLND